MDCQSIMGTAVRTLEPGGVICTALQQNELNDWEGGCVFCVAIVDKVLFKGYVSLYTKGEN